MIKHTDNIPKKQGNREGGGCWQRDIKEFINRDEDVMEIVIPDGRSAKNVANCVRYAKWQGNYPVKVIQRGDRVFLTKLEGAK